MDALTSVLLFLGAATWIGGLVTIFVVVAGARATLGDLERVAFMRAVGHRFLRVMVLAGVLMVLSAVWQLRHHPFDGAMMLIVVTTTLLAIALVFGVAQARAMGRLRAAAVSTAVESAEPRLESQVARGARRAAVLRGVLVALSIALVAQGALLVTAG